MLYFCFSILRETQDMIELKYSAMQSIVIAHVTKCHDLISRLILINQIPLSNLIRPISHF